MIPVLSRKQQQKAFGIDCGDAIVFGGGTWSPGGEHVQKILVKNVSNQTIKFKYELPQTKFFSMDFPELITLSPGTNRTLIISFRPVKYESYDDYLVFQVYTVIQGVKTNGGKFRLPVQANIAVLRTTVPDSIDFNFCPTNETTTQSFELLNSGQIDSMFQWRIPSTAPFSLEPSKGKIKAGESVVITANFSPVTATVFVAPAMCTVLELGETNQSEEKTMTIKGIGKYTYLSASQEEIDFGDMQIGAPSTERQPNVREFVLKNPSLVRATFRICDVENDHHPVFVFSPTKGVIESGQTATIKVRYTPLSAGEFTCDHFDITTPGGNVVRMTCRGRAVGPTVSIWKKNLASNLVRGNSLNFSDVEVGKLATRVVILRNHSDVPASFHFVCPSEGVFAMDRVSGIIPPLLETGITFSFTPTHPANFYRRVFCLIHNQSPLYVDILGTGYNEKARPSPFQQAHVDAYRLRLQKGLGLDCPDALEEYMKENGDEFFLMGAIRRSKLSTPMQPTDAIIKFPPLRPSKAESMIDPTRSNEAIRSDVELCHEFFIDSTDSSRPIKLHQDTLDFGSCSIGNLSEKQVFQVTNRTRGKVTCSWGVSRPEKDPVHPESSRDRCFDIYPSSQDIGAGATVSFKVAFRPHQENAYYFAELEAHVYFKSNRTFRLVNEQSFTPPWCVTLYAYGNTFGPGNSQFLPKVEYKLLNRRLCFPACHLGDSVFQTVMLSNSGDTPAQFCFQPDPSRVFSVKPTCGLISANSFQLVQFRFTPKKAIRYSYRMRCNMNNTLSSHNDIELWGTGCVPRLKFCQDVASYRNTLYIKPTATGLSSVREFKIQNSSRVPLIFRWKTPARLGNLLQLRPQLGRLNGNEETTIAVTIRPEIEKNYESRVPVDIKAIASLDDQELPVLQTCSLKVACRGTSGAISFSPNGINFNAVLVNSTSQRKLNIVNSSDCDLKFEFYVKMHPDTNLETEESQLERHASSSVEETIATFLSLSSSSTIIEARAHKEVTATFCPGASGHFVFTVECHVQMIDESGKVIHQNQTEADPLCCTIVGDASFPTVSIKDLYVENVSTSLFWDQLDIPRINTFLTTPLTRAEVKRNKDSTPDFASLPRFPLIFTPGPIGTPDEVVMMQIQNYGSLTVEFLIRLPNESEVEIEQWADTGEPSAKELRENIIIDQKIFQISPSQGTLQPHECVTISIRYAYKSNKFEGKHVLPVILQIDKGKQFIFDLEGKTLRKLEPYLFMTSPTFQLSPVLIGDSYPPVQTTELFNPGETALEFKIDTQPLKDMRQENYDIQVLQCLTPEGTIGPRGSTVVEWICNPLEAKSYSCSFKLMYQGMTQPQYCETRSISIAGCGYHSAQDTLSSIRSKIWTNPAPQKQRLIPESQKATLSTNLLEFGHIPFRSTHYRLVVLRNHQDKGLIAFRWDENHPLIASGLINVHPIHGKIEPLEHVVVRITITAGSTARVVDVDVPCFLHEVDTTPVEPYSRKKRGGTHRSTLSTSSSRTSVIRRPTASSIRFFGANAPYSADEIERSMTASTRLRTENSTTSLESGMTVSYFSTVVRLSLILSL